MADPDEALIEAIAAGMRSHRVECYTEGGDRFGWQCLTCGGDSGAIYRSIEVAEQYALGHTARAAYAAMVAHLGLVEEWQTRAGSRGLEWFEVASDYAQWAMTRDRGDYPLRHRLVQSEWVEVDHGSE